MSRHTRFALYCAMLFGVFLLCSSFVCANLTSRSSLHDSRHASLPRDPLDLSVAATGAHRITLYWSSEDGASSYTIFRSRKAGGPYTKVKFAPAASFSYKRVNHCRYTDTGLKTGVEYFYFVRSSNNERSEEASDTPTAKAIPWDTDNPRLILAASAKEMAAREKAAANMPRRPRGLDFPPDMMPTVSPDGISYFNGSNGSPPRVENMFERDEVRKGPFNASTKDAVAIRKVWDRKNDGWDGPHVDEWFPSPSDKYIVVVVGTRAIPYMDFLTDLELLSKQKGTVRALTHDGDGYYSVRWHPNEKQIAYVSRANHYDRMEQKPTDAYIPWTVYVHNIVSGRRIRLFQEKSLPPDQGVGYFLEWIPKRSQLLYKSSSPRGVFLLDTNGAKPKRLTATGPDNIMPSARLAYWNEDSRHRIRIARLPARTAEWTKPAVWQRLTPFVTFAFPHNAFRMEFSRTGEMAVLVSLVERSKEGIAMHPAQLVVVDPLTRKAHLLGVVAEEWLWGLSWSADGKSLILGQSGTLDEEKRASVDIDSAPLQSFGTLNWKSRKPAPLHPILPDAQKH